MCQAEGCGFKRHVQAFQILSSKACAHFDVRSFWRALARQNKKVLTEKCIIDSISSSNASYQVLVVHTANDIKGWKPNLDWLRHTLRQRADAHGGKLVAIVLDQHGHLVKQNDMSNDNSGEQISEIIGLRGGGGHMASITTRKQQSSTSSGTTLTTSSNLLCQARRCTRTMLYPMF